MTVSAFLQSLQKCKNWEVEGVTSAWLLGMFVSYSTDENNADRIFAPLTTCFLCFTFENVRTTRVLGGELTAIGSLLGRTVLHSADTKMLAGNSHSYWLVVVLSSANLQQLWSLSPLKWTHRQQKTAWPLRTAQREGCEKRPCIYARVLLCVTIEFSIFVETECLRVNSLPAEVCWAWLFLTAPTEKCGRGRLWIGVCICLSLCPSIKCL